MISGKEVNAILDDVEVDFTNCWDMLSNIKENSHRFDISYIFNFQPILATALFKLDSKYRELKQEEKKLISEKNQFSLPLFKRRMIELKNYQEIIKVYIKLGRALGDSFAWIFYIHDQDHLNKNYAHERIDHTPPGIGGMGELALIKNQKMIAGEFVLYHGITTFLRIGDISLINLKNLRVSAIAELKTKKNGANKILVNVFVSSPNKDLIKNMSKDIVISDYKQESELSPEIKQRLSKQLGEIDAVFKETESALKEDIKGHYHTNELNQIASELEKQPIIAYQKVGDGLLVTAIKNEKKTLRSRLTISQNLDHIKEDLRKKAEDLICANSNYNAIIIGSLDYTHIPRTTPLFWWNVDIDIIRKIFFNEIMITTLYNPCHLIKKMNEIGYDVEISENQRKYKLEKKVKNKRIEINGFEYYFTAIQNILLKEEVLIEICEKLSKNLEKEGSLTNHSLEIMMFHHL